jgi:hypothetical protein
MHDDARHHDDAKKKITSNSNTGDFSGLLHSPNVNALLWYFIKRSTLIISSFPLGPAATGW